MKTRPLPKPAKKTPKHPPNTSSTCRPTPEPLKPQTKTPRVLVHALTER